MKTNRQSLVFSAQNQIDFREEKIELHPPAKGALLQTRFSCISAGTEIAKLTGLQKIDYPYQPGNRAICRVLSVGSECTTVKNGDLVLAHSPHADIVAYEGLMVPLPTELDRPETSLLAMGLVSFVGVQQSAAQLGDIALVTGGGIVGNLAAQLLELSGATVVLADISSHRRDLAKACGISHVVNGSPDEVWHLVDSLTNGLGARVGLECSGRPEVCSWLPSCLERGGRLVLVGSPRGQGPEITPFLNHFHLFHPHGDLTLLGAHEWKIPPYPSDFHPHSMWRNARILGRLLSENRLKFGSDFCATFTPLKAREAYHLAMNAQNGPLGIVFDWTAG